MIKRFRHKGLERLFTKGDASGVNAVFVPKLRRMLQMLNESDRPSGMSVPNYRLHQLKGDRKGQWAVWVSGNWCSDSMVKMPLMLTSSIITETRRQSIDGNV